MQVIFSNIVSQGLVDFLGPLSLIVMGYLVEKHFVGRLSLFSNALALFVFYYGKELSTGFGYLLNTIIILGLVAGISRIANVPLPGVFYHFAWIGSGIVTGIMLLFGLGM